MLSRRTMREPVTGAFQMPVWTVLPCQATSRGRPTLIESNRSITYPNDDRGNLEVNRAPSQLQRLISPRCPAALATLLMSTTLFHSTFGRSESYQCMSGQSEILC